MKTPLLLCVLAAAALGLRAAEPKDEAQAALKSLREKSNYSWISKLDLPGSPFTPAPIHGKWEKGGFTMVSQESDGNKLEAVLKGDAGVVKFDNAWKTSNELSPAEPGASPQEFNPARMMALVLLSAPSPVEQLQELFGKVKAFKSAEGGVIICELAEDGAQDLLRFGPGRRGGGGPRGPGAKDAKGNVKLWVKEGTVVKYELTATGTVKFGDNEFPMEPKTTVEIKDIGSTKVDAPEAATKKLAP